MLSKTHIIYDDISVRCTGNMSHKINPCYSKTRHNSNVRETLQKYMGMVSEHKGDETL